MGGLAVPEQHAQLHHQLCHVPSLIYLTNSKHESLHPVAGAVLSNELQSVQLGQHHIGIAGGLQVQAAVVLVHHVHLLLILLAAYFILILFRNSNLVIISQALVQTPGLVTLCL